MSLGIVAIRWERESEEGKDDYQFACRVRRD